MLLAINDAALKKDANQKRYSLNTVKLNTRQRTFIYLTAFTYTQMACM